MPHLLANEALPFFHKGSSFGSGEFIYSDCVDVHGIQVSLLLFCLGCGVILPEAIMGSHPELWLASQTGLFKSLNFHLFPGYALPLI